MEDLEVVGEAAFLMHPIREQLLLDDMGKSKEAFLPRELRLPPTHDGGADHEPAEVLQKVVPLKVILESARQEGRLLSDGPLQEAPEARRREIPQPPGGAEPVAEAFGDDIRAPGEAGKTPPSRGIVLYPRADQTLPPVGIAPVAGSLPGQGEVFQVGLIVQFKAGQNVVDSHVGAVPVNDAVEPKEAVGQRELVVEDTVRL
jgi:hypothetical protein